VLLFVVSCVCHPLDLNSFPTRRSSDLWYRSDEHRLWGKFSWMDAEVAKDPVFGVGGGGAIGGGGDGVGQTDVKVYGIGHNWTLRSEEHTSELQSRENLVCRLLLEKKKN